MRREGVIFIIATVMAVIISLQFSAGGETSAKEALSGVVSSAAEGVMEGVLVSATRLGGNISMTVVSDKQGHYGFASNAIPQGRYKLSIRAVGYDLSQPELIVEVRQSEDLRRGVGEIS